MPRRTDKTAYLDPTTVEQLRALFGTAKNAHARLGLAPLVECGVVQRAMSGGYPIPTRAERLIEARWQEWRAEFLRPPGACDTDADALARKHGDCYHTILRDPVTELITTPFPRFTLADNPGKHLTTHQEGT